MEKIVDQLTRITVTYGPKLVGAILVWFLGKSVINYMVKGFDNILNRKNVDKSLRPFLKGIANILLKTLVIISVLGMLGVKMTPFIAIVGAIGLGIGMALSGTLQNFAGGIIILTNKPFEVGDYIGAKGYTGKVTKIRLINTLLKTRDNKQVVIPNGDLSSDPLVNYTAENKRRADWTFGVGYDDNVEQTKQVLKQLCQEDSRILDEPEVYVAVSELGDSSVNFTLRAWTKTEDYRQVYLDMTEKVYKAFNEEGLNFPYPQMDIHMDNLE